MMTTTTIEPVMIEAYKKDMLKNSSVLENEIAVADITGALIRKMSGLTRKAATV